MLQFPTEISVPKSLKQTLHCTTLTLHHTFWSILWLSTKAENLSLFYIKAIKIHCPGFLLLLEKQITLSKTHLKYHL